VKLALLTEPNPARAVARLNDQLMQGGIGDRFVTLVVMILEPATHRLTVVNAGHINPKLYTTATRELREVTTNEQTGLPIGIMPEFDYEAVTIELQPGDTIAAFTDGVTEAANPLGEMFGAHRLDQCLPPDTDRTDAGRPCRMGERLVNAVRKHADGRPQNDDIALVCFGRLEPESGPRTLPGPATDLMPRIE
jgi:serine phosphatase RsbU (regulator of sigma subunit)